MAKKLTCKDCKTELLKLTPPLSQRRGHDGQPMTRAEAIHLFVDTRGGRCTDCFLKREKAEVSRVAALHRADPGMPDARSAARDRGLMR